MWRREKVAAVNSWCWTYFLHIVSRLLYEQICYILYIYVFKISEVNHLIMESNLWSLNIEMFPFTEHWINSLELNWIVQSADSDLDDFNMQAPDCFVSFLLPENLHPWVFCDEFHELWIFVLLSHSHLGSTVCYFMWFVFFGCLSTNVRFLMMCFNVAY